jgi:hypothetical protein
VTDVCYNTGNLHDMTEKIIAMTWALSDRHTTVHVFVSMLKSRGEPIALDNERVRDWTDTTKALQACRSKPYVVINTTVLMLIDDPIEKEKYRFELDRMIEFAERYAFVDYGEKHFVSDADGIATKPFIVSEISNE